jgi:type II secretory ATPase GspE/PulE/Tfp pilus assembly ATPase PilB-like protein
LAEADETQAPKLLEELIAEAIRTGASDLHVHMSLHGAQLHLRLDGVMVPIGTVPENLAARLIGRIKFLARLKTYQESLPQDGRISGSAVQSAHDVRVATYPTVTGEKLVLRFFGGTTGMLLPELGLPATAERALREAIAQNEGLVLLTGPAGSGKTTTIYACLRWMVAQSGRHIITVEDPVEQILPNVMQTEVNEAQGLTFAKAGRHLLRQDPQVLVIGEIRDEETAAIAVRAALTGHLVISTLHGGSCQAMLERLWLLCPDRYAVLSALELIVNQRLLRRRCSSCQGAGCAVCWQTGYRGRLPVTEWVRFDADLRQRVRDQGSSAAVSSDTLDAAADRWIEQGLTDQEERVRLLGK